MAERVQLEVAGESVGAVRSFTGLDLEADVAERGRGPHNMPKKHVSNVRWTPGVAVVGGGMGRGMYHWARDALDHGTAARDGRVTLADGDGAVLSSLAFSGARITGLTFPKLDASDKSPATLAVEFEVRQAQWGAGGATVPAPTDARRQEWLSSNFRIEIGELPCQRVAKVESFTWKCSFTGSAATVAVPDLRLSIARGDYAAWADAARRWFVDGEHRDKHEMTGRITLLSPDAKTELTTIEFHNIGLKRFSREDAPAGNGGVRLFAVELYVEKIGLRIKDLDAQ